jgi:hypothetical protein
MSRSGHRGERSPRVLTRGRGDIVVVLRPSEYRPAQQMNDGAPRSAVASSSQMTVHNRLGASFAFAPRW